MNKRPEVFTGVLIAVPALCSIVVLFALQFIVFTLPTFLFVFLVLILLLSEGVLLYEGGKQQQRSVARGVNIPWWKQPLVLSSLAFGSCVVMVLISRNRGIVSYRVSLIFMCISYLLIFGATFFRFKQSEGNNKSKQPREDE
jgi:hypothetical protein